LSQINENSTRCANDNTCDSASYVAPNLSHINERWVNIYTHDSASYVASNLSQINKSSTRYSQSDIDFKKAMLEFKRKLEKQREDLFHKYFGSTSKRPITSESLAMSMKKDALPIGAVSKVRINSIATKCSATKARQHNILSESITSQKTSLAIEKHGKHKKPAKIDFSGAKGVVFLSSDYHIINDPQIIAEQCLANKTYQDDGDQAPTSKKEEKMHGGADKTS